ncbi:uncharacterized protein LOC143342091 [Colletes latitarsis]|uniref:uncharacterized protein LOC143342091 n=1 Tax=Colletes latitarsis TaxID=2605962 RepID=UPI0040351BEC
MTTMIGLLLIATWTGAVIAELPPGVQPCPRTADFGQYDRCVLKQLKAITPYLAEGIPALKLPALDPLFLPSLTVDRNLEALKIKANMSQIRVHGATNFLIDDLKANPDDLSVAIKVQLPHVHVNGDYEVQGRLLLLPLNGAGSFKGNFTNTEVQVNAQGKEVTDKNGIQRINVDKLVTKIRVGDGNIKLKAPPSHTLAADAAATFFNSNPRLVLDIASPIIEDTAATVSRALAARALGVLTKQELLPYLTNHRNGRKENRNAEGSSKMVVKELLFVVVVVGFANAEVPSYIHICGARNPKLDECVIQSVEALAPKLRKGIPELDIPPVDPLTIDRVQISNSPDFKAMATNIKLRGIQPYHVNFLHVDLEKQRVDIDLQFDEIRLNADYAVNARILVPISGNGPITLSTKDVNTKLHLDYKLVERNGKKYVYFWSITTHLDVKDYTVKFEAENFDKILQEAVRQALGNSHREILEATRPNLEKAISQKGLEMANKICKHFTFDELFPDRE